MTFTEQAIFSNAKDGDIRASGTGVGFERLREIMAASADYCWYDDDWPGPGFY